METKHLTEEQRRLLLEKLLNITREKSAAAKEIEKFPISPRERTIILSMFQEAIHKQADRLSEKQLDSLLEGFLKKSQGEAMNAINALDIDSRDKYLLRQRYQSHTSPQGPKIIQGYKVDPNREKYQYEAPPKKKNNSWLALAVIAGVFVALLIAAPYLPKTASKIGTGTTSNFAKDALQNQNSASKPSSGGGSGGTASGGGVGQVDVRSSAEIDAESREITLTEQEVMSHRYNDLENGMSYDDVAARLSDFGTPTVIAEDQGAGTATYLWTGPDNTEIMCFFENGELTGKSQQGLDAN